MNDFQIDSELHATLKHIRESVRGMFEQLRLRNENEDISGKERLERVPALAKRNFGNLVSRDTGIAIKEAWRLIDFLEGGAAAKLTPLARAGLRSVELDSQLARYRASESWRTAASRLRETLGASREREREREREQPFTPSDPNTSDSDRQGPPDAPETVHDLRGRGISIPAEMSPECAAPSRKPRRRRSIALIALGLFIAAAVLTAIWLRDSPPDPRFACLPLERASSRALRAHWTVRPESPLPPPAPGAARPNPLVFTISDPVGAPVRSIFTTSQFSFEEGGTRREGGGRADVRLPVGGWGDTYLSLLKFPIPDNRLVRRAVVRLVVLGADANSRPTTMTLRLIGESWDVLPGPQNRLWWRDCPQSEIVRRNLPAPGPPESIYDIDITSIYNGWARGINVNHGIMLEPEHIGSYGSSREHYANFSTFYSTRAIDPEKRPKLILIY